MRQQCPPPVPSRLASKIRAARRSSPRWHQSRAAMRTILCSVLSASSSPRLGTVWRRIVLGLLFARPAFQCCWVSPSIVLTLIVPLRPPVPRRTSSECHVTSSGDTLCVGALERACEPGIVHTCARRVLSRVRRRGGRVINDTSLYQTLSWAQWGDRWKIWQRRNACEALPRDSLLA